MLQVREASKLYERNFCKQAPDLEVGGERL